MIFLRSSLLVAALIATITLSSCTTEIKLDRRYEIGSKSSDSEIGPPPPVFQDIVQAIVQSLVLAKRRSTVEPDLLVFDASRRQIRLESFRGSVLQRYEVSSSIRFLNHPGRVFLNPDGTASWEGPDTTLWGPQAGTATASDITIQDRASGWICAIDLNRHDFRNLSFRNSPPG